MNPLIRLGAEILYKTGISPKLQQKRGRFVLTFHGVSKERLPHVPAEAQPQHSVSELRQTLDFLAHDYRFLSPDEFFAGEAGLLLSFDDGFANNYRNALPVLAEFNAPAIFFVATQHVEDPHFWFLWIKEAAHRYWGVAIPEAIAEDFYNGMSPDELSASAKHPLITIGAHSHSHPVLTEISPKEVDYELGVCKDYLENLIQKPVDYFAYPKGRLNERIARQVQAAGYRAAFGLRQRIADVPFEYAIPRIDLYNASPAYLTLKLRQKSL